MPDQSVMVDLAHYAAISTWQPKMGDIVIWHGWFTHWYGVVNQVQASGHISVIRGGLPLLLFTMDQDSMQKKTKLVYITKIRASRGGEWAAIQTANNQITWFV